MYTVRLSARSEGDSSIDMTPEEKFYEGMYGVGGDKIPFLPHVPANTITEQCPIA